MKICVICKQEKPYSEFYIRRILKRSGENQYYSRCKACESDKSRLRVRRSKREAIEVYGGICECCEEYRIEFLALDHIHGNGNQRRREGEPRGCKLYPHLKKLGYPQGEFRVLCHNCNQSLGNLGYCPHEEETEFPPSLEELVLGEEI